ncbi:MAG: hypothetical protein CL912_22330 [Deltaproteobacteria bacterium]|nr:hypothetical protein [Deltaproteobacteria bacterium]
MDMGGCCGFSLVHLQESNGWVRSNPFGEEQLDLCLTLKGMQYEQCHELRFSSILNVESHNQRAVTLLERHLLQNGRGFHTDPAPAAQERWIRSPTSCNSLAQASCSRSRLFIGAKNQQSESKPS